MSAAQHSLNLDKSLYSHYYHCVLSDIPFHTAVAEIAPHVVPKPESDVVRKLTAAGCRIVPHQLHVYKEPLDAKFGYVSFFIHQLPKSTASAAEIHQLMLEWIDIDLATQLQSVKCKVQLAQPPECHSSEPFLNALQEKCPLLDPGTNTDTKRLETFLLTRVRFGDLCENASINDVCEAQRKSTASPSTTEEDEQRKAQEEREEKDAEENGGYLPPRHSVREHVWKCVGTFSPSSLSPKELVWLKKQLPSFPPLLITDNNMASAHCDDAKLKQFFTANLAPLIAVEKEA
ncbi:hypothetical protein ABB37_01161 [Leptomonas pyrrhocoris]|uniref:Uncharacterized protein n=1 Tax=Leptomonas pyrrhocoris TaxID=157538 RepID=A0A0M9G890_LEPPY|nr:hypothetical protein ABB37_01161 [Leptomonas pyrrhocoris]XP_015663083.1 hypothetical protein ABB37_01161 [Leptomonas pyrrhocoris]KPA84643.1 hypothetical protein ABB37_01161 [Leptomonas pyrrhocoris]KPA84644.1 hypothetical protein ABB37_01161 [Leptomonas pyrrhocoris]|eukprot:XP_015663082.1 hypothetical protein ABB37_01161 [Leptomonas pyrrhocoris]